MNPVLRKIVQDSYASQLKTRLHDPERLRALYNSKFWDSPKSEQLRQFCVTAAMSLGAAESYIVMVADEQVKVVASAQLDSTFAEATFELNHSICPHVIGVGGPLPVVNAVQTPVICDVGGVREDGVIAYLGVPLILKDQVIGSLCVVDYREREWSEMDALMLTQLAMSVVTMHELGVLND